MRPRGGIPAAAGASPFARRRAATHTAAVPAVLSRRRALAALGLLALSRRLPAATPAAPVRVGAEVLAEEGFAALRGKRVGLLTNPTGVVRGGRSTIALLHGAPGVQLAALFGAEHGLDARAKAGVEVPDSRHAPTGLPVWSLYGPGPTRRPTARMLAGLDALVYDIQDTGCRSYTYISTLGLAMEACGAHGVDFVVLDRPNPLGGVRVEGPGLEPKFKSFVGQWPVPYVYGLTPGELARMLHGEAWIRPRPRLTVIPLRGWRRGLGWAETGLPWVPTSPNVPLADTPAHLVATGMLGEIGGLNLGTGTPDAFRLVGAAWLNPAKFAARLNARGLPGWRFEPVEMDFNRNPADGRELRGVRLHLTDPARAPLTAVNFHVLEAVKAVAGRDLFQLAVKRGKSWAMFDKVNGTDATRKALQAGRSATAIAASWQAGEQAFRERRAKYLLYPA